MLVVFIIMGILIFGALIGEIFAFALVIKEYIREYRIKKDKIMVIRLKEGMDPPSVEVLIKSLEHKVSQGDQ